MRVCSSQAVTVPCSISGKAMKNWTCTGVGGCENPVELQRAVSLCLVPLCLQPSRSDVSDAEPEREYSKKKKYASEPRKEKVKERKNRYWSLFSRNSKNFILPACYGLAKRTGQREASET